MQHMIGDWKQLKLLSRTRKTSRIRTPELDQLKRKLSVQPGRPPNPAGPQRARSVFPASHTPNDGPQQRILEPASGLILIPAHDQPGREPAGPEASVVGRRREVDELRIADEDLGWRYWSGLCKVRERVDENSFAIIWTTRYKHIHVHVST